MQKTYQAQKLQKKNALFWAYYLIKENSQDNMWKLFPFYIEHIRRGRIMG